MNGYLSCAHLPSSDGGWSPCPPRRIARKLKTSLRMTAKPGHCRFSVSTIRACRLVNSARALLNSAAAICGDSCLDPVEIVSSSCDASGNAEIALRVSAFGWRHGERNFASPEQRISESYDILFCDLAHGFIRSATEKLQKLVQTSLIKSLRATVRKSVNSPV